MADDFYVIPSECMSCGAPAAVAPHIMKHYEPGTNYGSCYFFRQPENAAEVDQAIAAIHASCCGAVC